MNCTLTTEMVNFYLKTSETNYIKVVYTSLQALACSLLREEG